MDCGEAAGEIISLGQKTCKNRIFEAVYGGFLSEITGIHSIFNIFLTVDPGGKVWSPLSNVKYFHSELWS